MSLTQTFSRRQLAREIRMCRQYFQEPTPDFWYGYVIGRVAQACLDEAIDLRQHNILIAYVGELYRRAPRKAGAA